MKINFVFPGKTREPFLAEGIAFYLKRLRPLTPAREVVFKSVAGPADESPAAADLVKSREASLILEHCRPGEYLIVLDMAGLMMSSPELAARLEKIQLTGTGAVNLVVGGPWGVAGSLLDRADLRLSLGPMTYPHELARLILLEQVYRAYAILNHLPYHK
ncbi:MAG: 23S rRNA (pseudouridine(1915)-N(3))-methyltransferase RlmH [Candidatus Adiutrix sp.]|jgi:23S rRNA (pseudouridine1915-N3)-methyltransferase|nr:23S rRNA (pseudouridine(1915)-N(3))-methyltransferase RlmH [Candidatus Adiutrix sp.]